MPSLPGLRSKAPILALLALAVWAAPSARSAGLPDLSVGRPHLIFSPSAREAVLAIPVQNRGGSDVETCGVLIRQRDGAEAPWTDETIKIGPLAAQSQIDLKFRLVPDDANARWGLLVAVDPGDILAEEDEQNNTLAINAVADLIPPPVLDPVPGAWAGEALEITGRTCPGWKAEALAPGRAAVQAEAGADGAFKIVLPLAEGANSFAFRAVAGGAWRGRAGDPIAVYRDSRPPEIDLGAPAENGCYRAIQPVFEVTDDLLTAIEITLDGQKSGSGAIETPGRHVLRLTARDAAGNVSSVIRHFRIDREPPALTIKGLEKLAPEMRPALAVQDENPGRAGFWIDGYLWRNGLAVTAPGRHTLAALAVDQAGNQAGLRLSFTVAGRRKQAPELTDAALGEMLPPGCRILLTRTWDLAPAAGQEAAVIFRDPAGNVRLGLAASGVFWTFPAEFELPKDPGRELAINLSDLDGDGAVEILAGGPVPEGRAMAILRWEAGAWALLGDFRGRDVIMFKGPDGTGRPAVLVRGADSAVVWQRTAARSGMGPQFVKAGTADIGAPLPAAAAVDPGWAFLHPISVPGFVPYDPKTMPEYSSRCPIRAAADLGGTVFALLCGCNGYWPALIAGDRIAPLQVQETPGAIGPSWQWPDPDGLFAADFDADGEIEPYFTVRHGNWRELKIYDRQGGEWLQVLGARVPLPENAYAPGIKFYASESGAAVVLSGPAETSYLVWDRAAGAFRRTESAPAVPPGGDDFLGRAFLAGADWIPNLW